MKKINKNTKGCIEFLSLQDLKGSIYFGGWFDKLSEISADKELTWDVFIVDEAHEGVDTYKTDTAFNHIRRKWTLHLLGTLFKALTNDKFPKARSTTGPMPTSRKRSETGTHPAR